MCVSLIVFYSCIKSKVGMLIVTLVGLFLMDQSMCVSLIVFYSCTKS